MAPVRHRTQGKQESSPDALLLIGFAGALAIFVHQVGVIVPGLASYYLRTSYDQTRLAVAVALWAVVVIGAKWYLRVGL